MKYKHWLYRFVGDYEGLVEDMDKIVSSHPGLEIINVQRISHRCDEEHDYLIYTRQKLD